MTSLLMTFINILIIAIWKSRQVFRAYGWGNMPLQAVKLPISHNNVVGENTVLQLNILETGVLTLVVQNSSPTRLRLVGDEFWTTCVRTPVSKMFWWRTYNSPWCSHTLGSEFISKETKSRWQWILNHSCETSLLNVLMENLQMAWVEAPLVRP